MKQRPGGRPGGYRLDSHPRRGPKAGGGVPSEALSPRKLTGGRITVGRAVEAHLGTLARRNYSDHTIRGTRNIVSAFLRLSGLREETPLTEVSEATAERAMAKLSRKYSPNTAWRYATGWVQLFRAFTGTGLLLVSPFARVAWPRRPKASTAEVLSVAEMDRLLGTPNLRRASGVRDRAILEVFYSTALRLSELAHLEVRDVDFGRGTVTVCRGKGGKARVVPLGDAALGWLQRYLKDVRPRWANPRSLALWVGQEGRPVTAHWIQVRVRRLGRRAGLGKPVTPHVLRRTCATQMLRAGASPWAVKGILGHADFRSLGRYVSLEADEVRRMHEKTHPRA